MLFCIPDILTPTELGDITTRIQSMPFVDGKETAGSRAKRVKNNEQVSKENPDREHIQEIVVTALRRNKVFRRVLLPKKIRPPLLSRYREGMSYGRHIDDALMGPPNGRTRSDISVTIFISDPTEYDGGDLILHDASGFQPVKLAAGAIAAYPSTSLHEVTRVTRGERIVCVTWIESLVREDYKRELLFDLLRIRDHMGKTSPDIMETDLAYKAYGNLLRLWADT